MGRPRKDKSQGLPPGVYLKSKTFYTVIQNKWIKLGTDLREAEKVALELREGVPVSGSLAFWFDEWMKNLKGRVEKGDFGKRTYDDYSGYMPNIKAFFGRMQPQSLETRHVTEYLHIGRDNDRGVSANREKAALSSCISWMVSLGHGGLQFNPCLSAPRNTETARARYVKDDEYHAVYRLASVPVRAWMVLIYRTLQRPEDVLSWTHENITTSVSGQRVLTFKQGKAGRKARPLSIILNADIEEALKAVVESRQAIGGGVRAKRLRAILADPVKAAKLPLISTQSGDRYTTSGLRAMFKRHAEAAGVKDYTIYDHKAKGATDMYASGTPVETICELCGHESVTTTEIYIKAHTQKPVHANARKIPEASKTPEYSQGKSRGKSKKVLESQAT